MAKKKKQHIVPAAYLKRFTDATCKEGYKKAIWVNSSNLDEQWRRRGITHRVFTKTRFYNLATDDPESPVIENYLSVIENHYDRAIHKLLNGEFSNEIFSVISLFVAIQFLRTKDSIGTHQKSWDKISEWADMFEGGERNRTLYSEISLKRLLYLAKPKFINPIHKCASIIINSTKIPFLTSDKPVVQCFYNLHDVVQIFYPEPIRNYINGHYESPFYFMPMTPWLAYVSHNAFEAETKGLECSHYNIIEKLNDLMLLNADEYTYSSMNNPVSSLPAKGSLSSASSYLTTKIFTTTRRLVFEIKNYHHDNELLILNLLNDCVELAKDDELVSIEVFDPKFSSNIALTGRRNCKVKNIDNLNKKIVIGSHISSCGD
ncbi:DUF4238 domain-containing protein [Pseudidiomarina sediminum]|uniref:DUF4238 domain-containing protein n=1 Tax=Pseudidiomarina sediminum TaxID=431675 RepID=A0A432YZI3_9GAMM|nr:DUF4238 domain-containing protein [Pseudidiomarina sediminum]RUO69005.1 DUF4238 domain-containing protein [Pseudidiomarina sediminum]